ncbi:MAG: hypothetical protein ABJ327_08220 [Litoreibacter sp.]
MIVKEVKLNRLLKIKYDIAVGEMSAANEKLQRLDEQLAQIAERRNHTSSDPRDQLQHERHLGWLDVRARELSVEAARAKVALHQTKERMAQELGRKTAFLKAMERRAYKGKKQTGNQLS